MEGAGLLGCPYAFLMGAATGSRTRGRSIPEPEWSVGGLKLGVAATKSGLPRKVWWEPFWAERAPPPRAGGYKPLVPPNKQTFQSPLRRLWSTSVIHTTWCYFWAHAFARSGDKLIK